MEFVFVDGEAPFSTEGAPSDTKSYFERVGREALVSRIQEWGASGVRMLVYLNRVGDADLEISRDLMSHRIYREQFWEVAEDLGRTDAFPPDAGFEDAGVADPILNQIGFRRVVSIVDTLYGGDQRPGVYSGTEEDTLERCSVESLRTVGFVSLGAIHSISRRLAKIDRFARMPDAARGAGGVSEPGEEEATDTQVVPTVDAPIDPPASSWEDEPEFATGTRGSPASDEEEAAP
jgi:hypothetical protein